MMPPRLDREGVPPSTPSHDPDADADAWRALLHEGKLTRQRAEASNAAHLAALREDHPEMDPGRLRRAA